jgi:hypothetical protein
VVAAPRRAAYHIRKTMVSQQFTTMLLSQVSAVWRKRTPPGAADCRLAPLLAQQI